MLNEIRATPAWPTEDERRELMSRLLCGDGLQRIRDTLMVPALIRQEKD